MAPRWRVVGPTARPRTRLGTGIRSTKQRTERVPVGVGGRGDPVAFLLRHRPQRVVQAGSASFFSRSGLTGSLRSRDSSSRRVGFATRDCVTIFVARALRILPGLYACLVVTAFVIAPLSVAIQGGSASKAAIVQRADRVRLENSTLVSALALDVGGTPKGIPEHGRVERFAVDPDVGGAVLPRCCRHRRGRTRAIAVGFLR